MIWFLRLATLAGAFVGFWDFSIFAFGYRGAEVPLALWAVAPFPIAYGLARKLAPGHAGTRAALVGFVTTLALATWQYVDAARRLWDGTESLSGLVVVYGPVLQYVMFGLTLVVAWEIDRSARARGAVCQARLSE